MDRLTSGGSPIHWYPPSKPKPPRVTCPLCNKKVSQAGLAQHVAAKHTKEK